MDAPTRSAASSRRPTPERRGPRCSTSTRSPARPISSWIRATRTSLYAAMYQRLRSAFGYNGGGPGSAIYKTIDGGATWKKLENGIPAGDKGRIALRSRSRIPMSLIALDRARDRGGTYRTEDAGATWKKMSRSNPRPMYYSAPVHRSHERQARLGARRHDLRRARTAARRSRHAQLARIRCGSKNRPSHDVDRPARLQPHARRRRRRHARELGPRA